MNKHAFNLVDTSARRNSCHLLLLCCALTLLSGCKDATSSSSKTSSKESPKKVVDFSNKLYQSITSKQLGDRTIDIKYIAGQGISIHPGQQPTVVSFDVSNLDRKSVKLSSQILPLPAEAQSEVGAGTVGVEVFIDGKSLGRKRVDRRGPVVEQVNLDAAKTMSIRVDNDNNSPRWDWCVVSFE